MTWIIVCLCVVGVVTLMMTRVPSSAYMKHLCTQDYSISFDLDNGWVTVAGIRSLFSSFYLKDIILYLL